MFRRRPPMITALEARAIAETACAAAGRPLEEPVTVRLTWPRHRTWYVSGRADVTCAGGPYVSVDA